jgi:DNA-3-methyladenine glycosylase
MIRCARALEGNLVLNGPGKVTKYLGIDRKHYGLDLTKADNIYMIDDDYPVGEIFAGKRINIDYAGEDKERLWRFYLKK